MLVTIVSFIVVLGILVFIHEFGHYIVAKKIGIRVEEFALGFGPKLISRQKGETVYSIRVVPLGGFCQMTGETIPDEDMGDERRELYEKTLKEGRCFHQKSVLERFLVIFMGPFMNFMLAVFLFVFIFSVYGKPVDTTMIGGVNPGQPAAVAGLEAGDEILEIDGQPVNSWNDIVLKVGQAEEEQVLQITFRRDEEIKTTSVVPQYQEEQEAFLIGITAPELEWRRIGFLASFVEGFRETWFIIYTTIGAFVSMITGRLPAGEMIGGPIMIANIAGQAARMGLENLLYFMAIISINLGIINLFPIPALDGGRILFIGFEVLRGKPVDPQKEGMVHFVGFVLLMILMVFVIYLDITRSIF